MARTNRLPPPVGDGPMEKGPTEEALVSVAVVEPLPCMRLGIAQMLENTGLYRVVVRVADGDALLAALVSGIKVDMVLMDVRPTDADGCDLLNLLRERWPTLPVLAYGLPADDGAVVRSYRHGARAMLPKDMDEPLLLLALDVMQRAGVFHTAHTQRVLLENPDGLCADERRKQKLEAQLTKRQLEVLLLMCRDDRPSTAQMARELRIKPRTVESHVEELFELFGVNKRPLLISAAIRLGFAKG